MSFLKVKSRPGFILRLQILDPYTPLVFLLQLIKVIKIFFFTKVLVVVFIEHDQIVDTTTAPALYIV